MRCLLALAAASLACWRMLRLGLPDGLLPPLLAPPTEVPKRALRSRFFATLIEIRRDLMGDARGECEERGRGGDGSGQSRGKHVSSFAVSHSQGTGVVVVSVSRRRRAAVGTLVTSPPGFCVEEKKKKTNK